MSALKHKPLLLLGCLAFVFGTRLAVAAELLNDEQKNSFFTNMEQALGQVNTLAVRFVQTRHVELFSEDLTARGITIFVAPNMIRHEITDPFQTVIISGPECLARYERASATGNWKKFSGKAVSAMSQVVDQIALWLKGEIRASQKQYDLTVYALDNEYQVKMVPKNKNMRQNISYIELLVSKDYKKITKVIMHENGGDYTQIAYLEESQEPVVSVKSAYFSCQADAPMAIVVGDVHGS